MWWLMLVRKETEDQMTVLFGYHSLHLIKDEVRTIVVGGRDFGLKIKSFWVSISVSFLCRGVGFKVIFTITH